MTEVKIKRQLIEPTDEERQNGWDAGALTAYLEKRRKAALDIVFTPARRQPLPTSAHSKYSPLRWRG